jgi:hypothetical protein
VIIYSYVPTIYLIHFSDYILVYYFEVSEKVLPPRLVKMILCHVSHPEDEVRCSETSEHLSTTWRMKPTGPSTGQQPSCKPDNTKQVTT